jgi:hypothetical protein
MLLACITGLAVLFKSQVVPAFASIGYGPEFERVMWIAGIMIGSGLATGLFLLQSAWREVVEHQKIHESAGYNKVGDEEWRAIDHMEAARKRLKARKRRA